LDETIRYIIHFFVIIIFVLVLFFVYKDSKKNRLKLYQGRKGFNLLKNIKKLIEKKKNEN